MGFRRVKKGRGIILFGKADPWNERPWESAEGMQRMRRNGDNDATAAAG
jgi:hypothetical protein